MATQQFSPDDSVENPTTEQLVNISVVDWKAITSYYEISITSSMWKEQLKKILAKALFNQGVLQEEVLHELMRASFPLHHEVERTHTPMLDPDKLFDLEKKLKLQIQLAEVEKEKEREAKKRKWE